MEGKGKETAACGRTSGKSVFRHGGCLPHSPSGLVIPGEQGPGPMFPASPHHPSIAGKTRNRTFIFQDYFFSILFKAATSGSKFTVSNFPL